MNFATNSVFPQLVGPATTHVNGWCETAINNAGFFRGHGQTYSCNESFHVLWRERSVTPSSVRWRDRRKSVGDGYVHVCL